MEHDVPPPEDPEPDPARNSPPRSMPRLLALVLGLLSLISIGGLSLIYWVIGATKDTIPYEMAKALIQLAAVAIAGAIISVAVFEYQRERQKADRDQENVRLERLASQERRRRKREAAQEKAQREYEADQEQTRRKIEYRDELLRSIMSRAIESYNSVKKTRRLLEARAKFMDTPVSFGQGGAASKAHERISGTFYDAYIEVIIDAQLQFETLKRDIETSKKSMTRQAEVARKLREMEAYLNDIIGEYKKKRREFRSSDNSLELSALTRLKAFLKSSSDGSFAALSGPMQDIQRAIREELLHPNLPDSA